MDKIILSGIEFYAFGGVTDAEKQIGQRYRATVELEVDLAPAAASDAIVDTIHYGQVYDAVVDTARERPFNLIESLADRIVERVLAEFPVERVTLRLEKLFPPIDGVVASAAVETSRERGSG